MWRFICFVLFFPLILFAKQQICLNMIVKNESEVITRCLDSVINVIDYWVIVDTGSTDQTKELIQTKLQNISGELHERPWKNFEANRNEALELAKGRGDYILFMDADDILEFDEFPCFEELTADLYHMWRGTTDFTYRKPQLVKADMPWKWIGVTHEYLGCDQPYTSETLSYVKYVSKDGGATHKDPKKKFLTNVELLTEGLKQEPNNSRYAFYLAESYRDLNEPGKALECYQKRIVMGGWSEEVFWSQLQSALLLQKMGLPNKVVVEAFLHAHEYRPHRLEPIYYAAEIYNQERNYSKAYEIIKSVSSIPRPHEKDSLFNMDWIEQYGLLFQLSICAYYVGNYEESIQACDHLLTIETMPEAWHKQVVQNREFPILKLKEKDETQCD